MTARVNYISNSFARLIMDGLDLVNTYHGQDEA